MVAVSAQLTPSQTVGLTPVVTSVAQPAVSFELTLNGGTSASVASTASTLRSTLGRLVGSPPEAVFIASLFERATGTLTTYAQGDTVNTVGNVQEVDAVLDALLSSKPGRALQPQLRHGVGGPLPAPAAPVAPGRARALNIVLQGQLAPLPSADPSSLDVTVTVNAAVYADAVASSVFALSTISGVAGQDALLDALAPVLSALALAQGLTTPATVFIATESLQVVSLVRTRVAYLPANTLGANNPIALPLAVWAIALIALAAVIVVVAGACIAVRSSRAHRARKVQPAMEPPTAATPSFGSMGSGATNPYGKPPSSPGEPRGSPGFNPQSSAPTLQLLSTPGKKRRNVLAWATPHATDPSDAAAMGPNLFEVADKDTSPHAVSFGFLQARRHAAAAAVGSGAEDDGPHAPSLLNATNPTDDSPLPDAVPHDTAASGSSSNSSSSDALDDALALAAQATSRRALGVAARPAPRTSPHSPEEDTPYPLTARLQTRVGLSPLVEGALRGVLNSSSSSSPPSSLVFSAPRSPGASS